MARKLSGIPSADPPVTDDFSLIKGIGPVLSRRLHEADVCTYSQLASFSPAQLAEKVGGLSARQIARQDWAGQAEKLTPKKTQSRPPQNGSQKRPLHQHYENFAIEFLLDEKKTMRRTRVVHIQSGDADTWAGWEADQLIDFLARHSGTCLPGKRQETKDSLPTSTPPPDSIHPEPTHSIIRIAEPGSQLPDIVGASHTGPEVIPPDFTSPLNVGFAGTLYLQDFGIFPIGSNSPARSLRHNQRFEAQLTLDLTAVVARSAMPLQYKVTITFKQLGGVAHLVFEGNNRIERSYCVTLSFICTAPPPGIYRPEAFVKLFSDETVPGLMAFRKAELIHVF